MYRSGYLQFANLIYQGEHLAAYAGESVIIRYNPRDITTIFIYQLQKDQEMFLTRAHAQGWEAEILSYTEAQAVSRRVREAGKALSNQSMLMEVRNRDDTVKNLQRQKKRKQNVEVIQPSTAPKTEMTNSKTQASEPEIPIVSPPVESIVAAEIETVKPQKPVPYVRVYEDYEQLKRESRGL